MFDRGVDIPQDCQVLWVQVGWKIDTIIAPPERQGCSVSLHPIGCDRMRANLAINSAAVENTVVGAVEPEYTTQWLFGI